MRTDLTEILIKTVGNIQKEMEKLEKTDWIMNLENEDCLFSIFYLTYLEKDEEELNVALNTKVNSEIKKIEKFFDIKSACIGKTVTMFVQVKEKFRGGK